MDILLDSIHLCYKLRDFNFTKECFIVPRNSYTSLHTNQQWLRASFDLRYHQRLVLTDIIIFFFFANLVVVKCFIPHVLNCISWATNEVNHLLIYSLAICVSSCVKLSDHISFAHSSIGFSFLFLFSCDLYGFFIYLDTNPFPIV